MKKLLVILTLVVAMTAFAGTASINAGGKTWFEVKLDKDGLSTNMSMWNQWASISLDDDALSVGIDFDGNLTLKGISLSNDRFAADWYSSMAFQGAYSKKWFVEVDDGAWAQTAIFTFKDVGLSLATQEGNKVLTKFAVDPINFAGQISLAGTEFTGLAVEVSSEDILAGIGFRVGYKSADLNTATPTSDYSFNVWCKNEYALGPVTIDVNPYLRHSNFNGKYVGVVSHAAVDGIGKLGIMAQYDYDPAATDVTLRVRFDGSYEIGPADVTVRIGSGNFADWDALWWEEFLGDLTDSATDLSFRTGVSIDLPFGIDGVLADPTLGVTFSYYLIDKSWAAPVSISSKLYDLLSVKAGLNLNDPTGWYAYVGYYAGF